MASLLGTAGCGGHSEEEKAKRVAKDYVGALSDKDEKQACELQIASTQNDQQRHAAWQDPVKLNERLVKTDTEANTKLVEGANPLGLAPPPRRRRERISRRLR